MKSDRRGREIAALRDHTKEGIGICFRNEQYKSKARCPLEPFFWLKERSSHGAPERMICDQHYDGTDDRD